MKKNKKNYISDLVSGCNNKKNKIQRKIKKIKARKKYRKYKTNRECRENNALSITTIIIKMTIVAVLGYNGIIFIENVIKIKLEATIPQNIKLKINKPKQNRISYSVELEEKNWCDIPEISQPYCPQYIELVKKYSAGKIDYRIVDSLIFHESSCNKNAWGDRTIGAGSWGLNQILLYYHPEVTKEQAITPEFSINWGINYLTHYIEKTGTVYGALVCYNGGYGGFLNSNKQAIKYAMTIIELSGIEK